jgi:hypothetical protein
MLIGDQADKCIALAALFGAAATSVANGDFTASLEAGAAVTFGLYAVRYVIEHARPG